MVVSLQQMIIEAGRRSCPAVELSYNTDIERCECVPLLVCRAVNSPSLGHSDPLWKTVLDVDCVVIPFSEIMMQASQRINYF